MPLPPSRSAPPVRIMAPVHRDRPSCARPVRRRWRSGTLRGHEYRGSRTLPLHEHRPSRLLPVNRQRPSPALSLREGLTPLASALPSGNRAPHDPRKPVMTTR
ncbi:hypothetical protein GCM10023220_14790 [Streptomyces ziwulingensis]|uniref:Uncharacterized protein n=1 Tax=Streptomyces ziwulingensis TaxID=1045501 RepID=A0ABP9B5B5_9ACTN